MRRRQVRVIGLICGLVGLISLLAGVDESLVHLPNAISMLSMGSTMVGVGWLCFAATRGPRAARKKASRLSAAEKLGLPLVFLSLFTIAFVTIANVKAIPYGQNKVQLAAPWLGFLLLAALASMALGLVLLSLRNAPKQDPTSLNAWRQAADTGLSITAANFAALVLFSVITRIAFNWWIFLLYPAIAMVVSTVVVRYRHVLRRARRQTQ